MRTKTLEEIKLSRLDNCYLVIYTFSTNITYIRDNTFLNKKLYTFIGLNNLGKKRFLGSFIDQEDNNRFWLDTFETFKSRGIHDILFLAADDNTNLSRCVKASFPNTVIIPSINYIFDKFMIYFSDNFSTKIKEEIKQLFLQDNIKDYDNIFTFFKDKYNDNIILKNLIDKYLINIDKLYKYDFNVRDVLFNTYKIHILKRKYKSNISQLGYIKDIDKLLEKLLIDLNYLENFTSYHKKQWLSILSSFYTYRSKELENII